MFDIRNKIKIFVSNGEVRYGLKVEQGFFPVFSVKKEEDAKLLIEMVPWTNEDTLSTYARKLEDTRAGTGPNTLFANSTYRVEQQSMRNEIIVKAIIADHPNQADAYRKGKTSLLGFFVGQMMRATSGHAWARGAADAEQITKLIRTALETT